MDGLVENTKSHLNGGIKDNLERDIDSNADPFLLKEKLKKSWLYLESLNPDGTRVSYSQWNLFGM